MLVSHFCWSCVYKIRRGRAHSYSPRLLLHASILFPWRPRLTLVLDFSQVHLSCLWACTCDWLV